MSPKIKKMLLGLTTGVIIVFAVLIFGGFLRESVKNTPALVPMSQISKSDNITIETLVNMSEDDIASLKEKYLMKMVSDTAKAYHIKQYTFCGLTWHESSKFKFANKKIKDSNGRFSYGMFMIQMETAILYDKTVTETKLLTPAYNTHLAAIIFTHNLEKYNGSYDYTLAAHNAGAVYNNRITNPDFIKQVKIATADIVNMYDL